MLQENAKRLDSRLQKMKIEIDIVKSWNWRIAKTNLRRKDFCRKSGVPPQSISMWTSGRAHPTTNNITRMEVALIKLGV